MLPVLPKQEERLELLGLTILETRKLRWSHWSFQDVEGLNKTVHSSLLYFQQNWVYNCLKFLGLSIFCSSAKTVIFAHFTSTLFTELEKSFAEFDDQLA